jgi:hypothetical protein
MTATACRASGFRSIREYGRNPASASPSVRAARRPLAPGFRGPVALFGDPHDQSLECLHGSAQSIQRETLMNATRYIVTAILAILFGSVPFAAVAAGCWHVTQTQSAGL